VPYTFEAQAGDVIGIQMTATSGDLDPYIVLIDPNSARIAENDDDPQGTSSDAYLRDFTIPATGTYTILAARFQEDLGSTQGNFTLRLEKSGGGGAPVTPTTPVAQGSLLNYGSTVTGEIKGSTGSVQYQFAAKKGDVIGISMKATSGNLDTYIVLIDPGGARIVENDDDPQGTTSDAYLRDFTIPADGTYTILAARFQEDAGTTEGTFSLTLEKTNGDSGNNPTPQVAQGNLLNYSDTVQGSIDSQHWSQRYTFQAHEGDVIGIQMTATSGDLDCYIILLDSSGATLVENDDDPQGITSDAYLRSYKIAADGTYTIVATRFQEDAGITEGNFTLRLEKT
jgi:1-aminocyclopropane-1-carboxylate deaminase/D-cysteine desulfhydrase-like pyridoxal-dependent ACC family enzyme